MATVAVVLMNYGGPKDLDGVEPYLRAIFADPAILDLPWYTRPFRGWIANRIVSKRTAASREQYASIGGSSPLLANTEAQRRALAAALEADGDFRTLVAMRYSPPRASAAAAEIERCGAQGVVALPLYPHHSRTTTTSSLDDLREALAERGLGPERLPFVAVERFWNEPGYISAIASEIRRKVSTLPEDVAGSAPLVFSAHGLPVRIVAQGDPYQREIEECVAKVCERLAETDRDGTLANAPERMRLCYQSKVGGGKWLEPSIEQEIDWLVGEGHRHAVLYPISFVSDHSETLYELDILYAGQAQERDLTFHRVDTVGDHPDFIDALHGVVIRATAGLPELPVQA